MKGIGIKSQQAYKSVILLLVYAILVYKLYYFEHWDALKINIPSRTLPDYLWLVACVLLMPLNWFMEVLKWQFLLRPLRKTSFLLALKSVYFGLTASLITPGSIGDWPGRALVFPNKYRRRVTALALFNSLIKTLAIILAGLVSWAIYLILGGEPIAMVLNLGLIVAALVSLLIVILIFLFSRRFMHFLFRRLSKKSHVEDVDWLSIKYRLGALSVSLFRVVVFTVQFIFLARFFVGDVLSGVLLFLPPLYFMVLTFIPVFSLVAPGIRAIVAFFVFQNVENMVPMMAVTGIVLWVVNTVLPMLAGTLIFWVGENTELLPNQLSSFSKTEF